MREMKYSGSIYVGDIPTTWGLAKVKHFFYRAKEEVKQDNPTVLSLARSGVKVRDLSKNEGQIAESYYNYNPVKPGDLLLNPMDLYSGANCSISKVEGVISPAYMNLRNWGTACPNFYDYFFKTQYWSMAFFAHGEGVSFDNRWTMNADAVLNYPIPVPPLSEQQLIARFLESKCHEIDTVIEKTRLSIEEYRKLKQSIITKAVTIGIRGNRPMKESGMSWVGIIPKEWTVSKLNALCSFHNGDRSANYPSPDDFNDYGIPFCGADALCDKYVNLNFARFISREKYDSMGGLKIQSGDILYTLRGSTIGKNAIAQFNNGTVASSLMGIRCKSTSLNPLFLLYLLNSSIEYQQRDMCINGSTAPNLSADDVSAYRFPIPPIDEQIEIVAYLDKKCTEIDSLITAKEKFINELEAYKKSLIYEYVTGKKEVL